jgi:hypothetical protein
MAASLLTGPGAALTLTAPTLGRSSAEAATGELIE